MGAVVVAHWVTISFVPHWWGGWTYGPRLFSDMVPFLVVLAVPAVAVLAERDRAPVTAWLAVSALVTASFLINAEGAWTWSSWCWNATPSVDSKPSRVWNWSDPQFLAGARGVAEDGLRAEVQPGIAAYACPA